MNRPSQNLQPDPDPDPDLGPLDEHGQQIWSPEEEAAIARLNADPQYQADIEEALADLAAGGPTYSTEEVFEHLAELRRQWFAERGL